MNDMRDPGLVQQAKDRLADRYMAAELCELLEVPVEDIIEVYWEQILDCPDLKDDLVFELDGDE